MQEIDTTEPEFGGFDQPFAIEEDAAEAAPEPTNAGVEPGAAEPEEDAAAPAPEPTDAGVEPGATEPEPTDAGVEPGATEPEATKPDPLAALRLQLAQQQAVIQNLQAQMAGRQSPPEPDPPEPEWPTEDEWAEDTMAAQKKLARALQAQQQAESRKTEHQRLQTEHQQLMQAHEAAFSQVAQTALGQHFKPGGQLRPYFEAVFTNPQTQYFRKTNGVLLAAQHIDRELRAMQGRLSGVNSPPPAAAPEPADALTAERKRQQRVRQAAMHGSGKGGGQAKVFALPQSEIARAKSLGMDPAALENVVKRRIGGE